MCHRLHKLKARVNESKHNNEDFSFPLGVSLVHIFYMIFTSIFRFHKWKKVRMIERKN